VCGGGGGKESQFSLFLLDRSTRFFPFVFESRGAYEDLHSLFCISFALSLSLSLSPSSSPSATAMFSTAAPSRAQASAMLPGRIAWSPSALLQGPTALAPRRVQAKPQKSVASAMLVVGAASTTTLLSTSSSPSSTSSSSSSPSPSRRPRSSVAARAAAAASPSPPPLAPGPEEDAWRPGDALTPFMADRKRWLEGDLPHLFDDVGIDRSGYAEVVEFRDPITSVSYRFLFLLSFFRGSKIHPSDLLTKKKNRKTSKKNLV